jgi:hypothetical protein
VAPGRGENFAPFGSFQTVSVVRPTFYARFLPGREAAETSVNHSVPTNSEVNAWRFTFTLPCNFMVCTGERFLWIPLFYLYNLKQNVELMGPRARSKKCAL